MARIKTITKAQEFKIWDMLQDGKSQRNISEELDISLTTVNKYAKKMRQKGYEPPTGIDEEDLEELRKELDDSMTREEKMEKAFDLAIDMLYVAVNKGKEGWVIEDERRVRIPIKSVMDCIEKAGKHAKTMSEAAKAARAGITPETIDYQEMAKLYVSFNKETGKFEYDAKKHMEEVLNKAYRKET